LTWPHFVRKFGIADRNGFMIPGDFIGCEVESSSGMKLDRSTFENAKPDLGTG
jgi:hypothetical protein